jgi:hypothetical protein
MLDPNLFLEPGLPLNDHKCPGMPSACGPARQP